MSLKSISRAFGMAASLALVSQTASAAMVWIDPIGTGGANQVSVGSLDFLPGNSLNQGALLGGGAQVFTNLFHARLGSFVDGVGDVIQVPGLNAPNGFEITVVSRFDVAVTNYFPGPFTTTTNTAVLTTGVNFVEFYYDPTPDANELAGTGFNDGTLILSAMASFGGGTFVEFNFLPNVPFDQFNNNDYLNTVSRSGVGGVAVDATVLWANPAFFPAAPAVISLNAQTTNSMPFQQINPSQSFWNGTAMIPAMIGPVNGVTGPDIQVQTDATVSFVVPEPASLSLLGLVSAVLGVRRRRNR